MNKLEELKRAKREVDAASSYIAQCEAGAALHSRLFELLPHLIAVAEAAKLVSGDHNGPYVMSPPERILANELALKLALEPLTKDTDK